MTKPGMPKYLVWLRLSAIAARAEIAFSGSFFTARDEFFPLTEAEGDRSSGWLKLGQTFGPDTIECFAPTCEVIPLSQGGTRHEVPLRASKGQDDRTILTDPITLLQEQVEGVRAALFLGEEAVSPLREGIVLRIRSERRPDGDIFYPSGFELTSADGNVETMSYPSVIPRPGIPFSMRLGDLGYTFKP